MPDSLAVVVAHIDHVHVVDAVYTCRVAVHSQGRGKVATGVDGVAVDRLAGGDMAEIITVREVRIAVQIERVRIPGPARGVPAGQCATIFNIDSRRNPREQTDGPHYGIDHLFRTGRLEHDPARGV